MRAIRIAVAVAALAGASAAMAQDSSVGALEAAARLAPADGGAAIELANAYWRAGRVAQADGAYRRALKLDNVMMETRTGDAIWSHEIAARVLARNTTLASR